MIAIQPSAGSFSEKWIPYCREKGIAFKLVDCYANDIIEQLQGCDAFIWHHHHGSQRDIVFARQLLFALEQAGIKVFPDFNTSWHFDDKLGQKYLFEKLGIEAARAFVFYTRKEALDWVEQTNFPKVFKLRGGASSSNVKLAKDKAAAISLVNKAFGSGFSQYQAMDNLKERIRKYKLGKTGIKDVLKGVVRLANPPASAKVGGRERGYVYFQEFIPGNDHDIRVVVVGDKAFAIKRMVRENDFRASGGGHILYAKELFDDSLIRLSFDINKKIKSQCLALDFVFDNGKPLVVEISFGFFMVVYDPCPGYWTEDLQWHEGSFNPYGWMVDDMVKRIQA